MSQSQALGLRNWIWRAFVQSALIPLLLVETVLIGAYLLTNSAIRDAQIGHLRQTALNDLQATALREAVVVDEQLSHIDALLKLYTDLTAHALRSDPVVAVDNLALSTDGVRYSLEDRGGAAVFYSNATPAGQQDLDKLARLGKLEPLMRQIQHQNPLVASVYFNSWDSLNHIYPWFNTLDQYPHDMVIPDYNFYYLADAARNPSRGVVWTDVYLDPAGQGWMMSAIAPVYHGDFLEGVTGLDVTVSGLLKQIGQLQVPWNGYSMLVGKDLGIMAMPPAAEEDFSLGELTQHSYEEAIRRELLKPEDFNLDRHEATRGLAKVMATQKEGVERVFFNGRAHLVAWSTIAQTDWHLLTVVDEADVFAQTNTLASHYKRIGYLLIAGLVLFYLLFFSFMWARSLKLSRELQGMTAGISAMMAQIGAGHWRPMHQPMAIREFEEVAGHALNMGAQLEQGEVQREQIHQRLELVLDSATESLWEWDLPARTMKLRGRLVERIGPLNQSDNVSELLTRVHPDDRAQIEAAVHALNVSGRDQYETKYRFQDVQGQYHWLLSRGRVLARDPQTGEVTQLAGTHVDIDDLKAVEDELRHATLQAQEANRAKSRFISSVSHELRTPLNAIHGFAQLMQMERQMGLGSEHSDYLAEILKASQHLDQLVADVLDLSAAQAERPELALQMVEVGPVMAECADLVRLQAQSQGLTFELDLPPPGVQVMADPRRLRQVLLNLLGNALKYNRPAGRVTLGYQCLAGRIRLVVEDTGLGVDAAQQAHLFEPFQRLGRENSAIQGTGIGLSLCREFAELMGAQMGVLSEPGVGSRFWIELGLLEGLEPPRAAPRPAGLERPSVFYVEDNPASQLLVCKALADLADITMIGDGLEALELLLEAPPALLLLDIDLPGMDGIALLQALRASEAGRHLPVIILSAMEDLQRLHELDCQGLLSKPLDLEELRGLVCALLHENYAYA